MTTCENFAFSYTSTAQKLHKQVLLVLKLLPIADEVAFMQTSATSSAIGNTCLPNSDQVTFR
jgi:hypothetical protein